jgi:putative heme-binding domain-containing protein
MTVFHMKGGVTTAGVVAYESAEGVMLRTGVASTIRLNAQSIERRELSERSLMPEGLLNGLVPGQLADLYAYLRAGP